MLDLARLAATPLGTDPYDHLVTTDLIAPDHLAAINGDFPGISGPGIYPLSELSFGPAFAALVAIVQGPELRAILAEKFAMDLEGLPQLVTVRGHCRKKDGQIHRDSRWKKLTVLLYLNEASWGNDGGRLRLLRGPDDIEDVVAEVPPQGGTLVAFRPGDGSFHGHKPFVGPRRYIMFNWASDRVAAERELARHRFSARLKRWLPAA